MKIPNCGKIVAAQVIECGARVCDDHYKLKNSARLESVEVIPVPNRGNDDLEIRVNFDNHRHHSVLLSKRHPIHDVCYMLRLLANVIGSDKNLK